ncbi:hypothetical protein SAY87_018785 [Trapa incisa]|uniref:Expp1 protein n=1 Tax=Trapa incisa TaxID=236973 RepID=A0AAN7K3E3_9MYRT|nr:hypothetical protein SAY87_018785 [Trapa incisa]
MAICTRCRQPFPAKIVLELAMAAIVLAQPSPILVAAGDTNDVFSPCSDAKVQKSDGFTFGIAISSKDSFFHDQVQLSPCDRRLGLAGSNAQLAVFRSKVDELSLLTINNSSSSPAAAGGYMVAFAGRQYAARSAPALVSNDSHIITSFTLVLEFQKGTLQDLFWKNFGCDSCSGQSVCIDGQGCGVPNSNCGSGGCNIGIQLAFSGTDRNENVLNSWYEVKNLRQYSLFGLYSDLKDRFMAPF